MLTKYLLITHLITLALGADHNTFKDCARVEFCTNLRNRTPSNDYTLHPTLISGTKGSDTLTATLISNIGTPDLILNLTGLQQNSFRLKITDHFSTPSSYELQDVLDGDPETENFATIDRYDTYVKVTTASGSNSVILNFSPFSIEFLKDGVSEVIFDGDRFTMNTNESTAPFSLAVAFPQAYQLYGIHEHCDNLALQNTAPGGTDPYRLKNSDTALYELNSPMALYGAVPVLYGHGPTATAGIFLHNAAEQWIETTSNRDGGTSAYFMAETGTLDLFIFLGPGLNEVVRQYTTLTGTAYMPQLWTLGYHQSRSSYQSQDDVKDVLANFESHNFQLDAIWLDINYTDGYRYFTWNPDTYSDPINLQETIANSNKKLVTIIDPHIKVEQGYFVYDGALAEDLFIKNSDGSVFEGSCWPGTSSYMDFLNPAARDYYGSMYSYDNFQNTTPTIGGIWNDMNEPAVFDGSLENTVPADALHFGNVRHREIHNIYGFLHTMATHQGLIQRDNGEVRPFILTRSHFAGSQRHAAFWTGDNTASWGHLHAAFQMCLNANILGLVFCGADVAGFFNNPTNELMERWYQAGAWIPFYRAHSNRNTDRHEPYLLPEDSQAVIRDAIQVRYKHLPTWYTLFYEHTRSGDPIIRPLFYQYPQDTSVYNIDNQLLVGSDILVRAVHTSEAANLDMYFPGGENEMWVSVNNDDVQAGNGLVNISIVREYLPVYYRRGGIIVRKDIIRSNTVEMINDGHTLYYSLNPDNTAHGTVYLDDGVSFRYRDDADFNYISLDVNDNIVTFTQLDGDGNYDFIVDAIVRRDIVKMPEDGQSGAYAETVFTTDANGVKLKDMKINFKEKMVIRL